MDRNFFLAFALSFLVLTGWMFLQAERRKEMEAQQPPALEREAPGAPAAAGEAGEAAARAETAAQGEAGGGPAEAAEPAAPPPPLVEPEAPEELVRIRGERFVAELTNRGAALTHWELTDYEQHTPEGNTPIVLTTAEPPHGLFAATPLEGLGLGDLSHATYAVEAKSDDAVSFVLRRGGIVVRKRWGFERDGYAFRLSLEVENGSGAMVSPRFDMVLPAEVRAGQDYREQALIAYHEGKVERAPLASVGTPGIVSRLFGGGSKTPEVKEYVGDVGWAGVDLRYFVAAVAPDRGRSAEVKFEPVEPGEIAASVISFEPVDLPPGQRLERSYRAFLGPKKPQVLQAFGDDLDNSINRGWTLFAPLVRAFEWMLKACYAVIPNYGIAIIVLTVMVRLLTAPIMARQMRSMERMRELQPRMTEIKEKYADDRQAQSEAMMKMYKEVGFNPLGGCLPMFLQLPVFIGLFYALQSSFELRQAPFFGWITDLSAPEQLFTLPGLGIPVRLLPLLMGVSMVAQQKLQPTTIDPQQARMMVVIMPVMFVALFYQFPSGLVLYWMMSNLLGIAHQMWVNRGKAPRTA